MPGRAPGHDRRGTNPRRRAVLRQARGRGDAVSDSWGPDDPELDWDLDPEDVPVVDGRPEARRARYADDLYGPAGAPSAVATASRSRQGPPGGGRHGGRHARRPAADRRRRHPVLLALSLVVVVALLVAGGVIVWARGQIDPGGKPGRAVTVQIPRGSSTSRIGTILARAHVIRGGGGLFAWYVKLEGLGPLYAGTYHLPTGERYAQVVQRLETAPTVPVDTLVIPEGLTLRDIAARVAALPGMHISAASFLALSSSGAVRSPFEPAGVDDLEGLVFPATYQIARTDSATDIMELLVQTFVQRAGALGLSQAAAQLHVPPYAVVEVASIIQGEAKYSSQFPDVASVIYNRLQAGMTLGADSTLVYALRQKDPGINVNKIDYNQPNPYNTRLNKGLPPTPIDNPGATALAAAAKPPHTDLLYFVEIAQDGKLGFASTSAGFDQLVATCHAHGLC